MLKEYKLSQSIRYRLLYYFSLYDKKSKFLKKSCLYNLRLEITGVLNNFKDIIYKLKSPYYFLKTGFYLILSQIFT